MRLRVSVCFGACLLATAGGCCYWRDRPPHNQYAGGWSSQPYAGTPSSPPINGPEILTPTAPGTNGVPPLSPPSSSRFAPPGWSAPGVTSPDLLPPTRVPIDNRFYGGPSASQFETVEPPLAPTNPFAAPRDKSKTTDGAPAPAQPIPPDLRDPREPERITVPPVPEIPEPIATPGFSDGIPGFAEVKNRISSGLKPDPEGLDWLKANRYQTVLHIRKPGAPHSADQEQIEKRGMKYLSLEVSPETLSPKLVADFNAIVAERGNRPLFVYDKDGTLAGALWYLHFRTVEQQTPEAARNRAARLGLQAVDSGDQAALWIAIQKLPLP